MLGLVRRLFSIGKLGKADRRYKGYFATEAALRTAHPSGVAGDWAVVQKDPGPDTAWYWNADSSDWGDSGQSATGDMVGPEGGTAENELVLFAGATGKAAKGSSTLLSSLLQKNGTVTPTANLPMGGYRLTGVGAPVDLGDAATKRYADGRVDLVATTDFSTTAASASTITMATDQTANIEKGMLVEVVNNGNTYQYRVQAVATNLLTLMGPALNTGAGLTTAVRWFRKRGQIVEVVLRVLGSWAAATDADLLTTYMGFPGGFRWDGPAGKLLGWTAVSRTANTTGEVQLYLVGDGYIGAPIVPGNTPATPGWKGSPTEQALVPDAILEVGCTATDAGSPQDVEVRLYVLAQEV